VRAIELFAGAGGLALGVSRAGFSHAAVIEIDRNAVATLQLNQARGVKFVKDWPINPNGVGDVRHVDYSAFREEVDLLAAGAPCQPFSIGGRGRGHSDHRNMFPEVLRAMRELRPKAVLIENVKGLIDARFTAYLDYIMHAMRFLSVLPRPAEDWVAHCRRLRACVGEDEGDYAVQYQLLNAADFGVPQWRERVFIVAFRRDIKGSWCPPKVTHSLESLLWAQRTTGEYWTRHGIRSPRAPLYSKRIRNKLQLCMQSTYREPNLLPWKTIRDANWDLPKLSPGQAAAGDANHFYNPGARVYRKHTGSSLDEPAKTLKAGSHGVPGGENSLRLPNGRVRYLTVRECARIQSFPDDFFITGSWCGMMRQLGNAVPVLLAEAVAKQVRRILITSSTLSQTRPRTRGRRVAVQ